MVAWKTSRLFFFRLSLKYGEVLVLGRVSSKYSNDGWKMVAAVRFALIFWLNISVYTKQVYFTALRFFRYVSGARKTQIFKLSIQKLDDLLTPNDSANKVGPSNWILSFPKGGAIAGGESSKDATQGLYG